MKSVNYCILIFMFTFASTIFAQEDEPPMVSSETNENSEIHKENTDQVFTTTTTGERTPDSNGTPRLNNPRPHHHREGSRQRDTADNIQSHRSAVYDVVNQPCFSNDCNGGYSRPVNPAGRWPQRNNRYVPYPYYGPRRRGGFSGPEYYPGNVYNDYGPSYAPVYPDYGYGSRMPPYPSAGYGTYNQPPYGYGFLF